MNSVTISWKLRLFMKVFKFMVFACNITLFVIHSVENMKVEMN